MTLDNADLDQIAKEISRELREENLAVFVGAGLSSPAGFVDWNQLLAPIANELKLDVDKEHDLITLAQYYINVNLGNRGPLNKLLIDKFSREAKVTENHEILARLPVNTYWTTNFDKLIEKALSEEGKVADVKHTKRQLLFTKPKRNAIVYKMHGDIDNPGEAVIIKDDYERFHLDRQPFMDALRGDLLSKTFLFFGFSFSDPNLDYILSRVRVSFSPDQRQHYCFLRKIKKRATEDRATFEYRRRKQQFFVQDLRRVGVKTVMLDEYEEVTLFLRLLEKRYRQNTIFVSGAAQVYDPYDADAAHRFVYALGQEIIKSDFRIVTGFGIGIGSSVIGGALNQIYMTNRGVLDEQLIMRPFPQPQTNDDNLSSQWSAYRRDMISRAGIAIFLFGNKESKGKIVLSQGMREEFEIAKEQGLFLIPIGATGFMAEQLWHETMREVRQAGHQNPEISNLLSNLGKPDAALEQVCKTVIQLLKLLNE